MQRISSKPGDAIYVADLFNNYYVQRKERQTKAASFCIEEARAPYDIAANLNPILVGEVIRTRPSFESGKR